MPTFLFLFLFFFFFLLLFSCDGCKVYRNINSVGQSHSSMDSKRCDAMDLNVRDGAPRCSPNIPKEVIIAMEDILI